MTTSQQLQIRDLVLETIESYGSQARAANFLGVNAAYVSHLVNNDLDKVSEQQWHRMAQALRYNPNEWKVVECFNTKAMDRTLADAKEQSMMLGISAPAGIGKTSSAERFCRRPENRHAYFLQVSAWRSKKFLKELSQVLGLPTINNRNVTADQFISRIVEYVNSRAADRPLIVIDEAGKLHPQVFLTLIALFNATEDRLGIVLMGTHYLEHHVNNGVGRNRRGFDEVSSRLGRKFVKLYGMREKEVAAAANANGVADKAAHKRIWKGCEPREVKVGTTFVPMAQDLRRMKRLVIQERLMLETVNA